MIIDDPEDILMHYGILRKSGRYPWGSGNTPEQRSRSFLKMQDDLKKDGFSDPDIARALAIGRITRSGDFQPSTTDLRALRSIAKSKTKAADISMARRLKEKQMSNIAIGERMGLNESSVRALLKGPAQDANDHLAAIASMLKGEVDKYQFIDIGVGTEMHIGVSDTRLKTAVAMLKEDGYEVHNVQASQLGTTGKTTIKVLAPPGTTYRDIASNQEKIHVPGVYSEDGGRSFFGLKPPQNLSSKRLSIKYASADKETDGSIADGTIYIRRGVSDLSMGGKNYAQVRIQVDGTHYIKGMAMYKDDLPSGVDVQFNTNKSSTGNKLDALKPLKKNPDGSIDTDNPFGAVIKTGGQKGVLNIVNEEGDWDKWSKSLASQMLSKQPNSLAKAQLDIKLKQKQAEFDEIMSLTNPVVRKTLLDKFAEDADSSAVHLKAANLPGQRTQVILPLNSMKDNEIYAPNYKNGDTVVLIRYPHGGKFEIPELTVNNRNPKAKAILGNAKDAVGINSNVAKRLSGADFDGDTVLVIPNDHGKVKTTNPLPALKDFDPAAAYPRYEGMPKLDDRGKQRLMGEVTNLVTDMTIRGAPNEEIARAVKHSMVVIDAEKHDLNYKLSAKEQGINQLKEKYQGIHASGKLAGASTIISKAQSKVYIPEKRLRKASEGGPVDPKTGKLVYVETGSSYTTTSVSKSGISTTKVNIKGQKSKALAETHDAFTLTSGGSEKNPGTPIEAIYATHSNKLKALANTARLASYNTPPVKRSPTAAKAYEPEVSSLRVKLNTALRNAPLERQATIAGNAIVKQKRQANPDMSAEDLKKIKGQALTEARIRMGAKKEKIVITPKEWDAIQAHAISTNLLSSILKNTDTDIIKAYATPRNRTVMTDAKMLKAKALLRSGNTQADVAAALGVPISTLTDALGL